MNDFAEFLVELFQRGRISFRSKPVPMPGVSPDVLGILERAYVPHRLELAGAAITLDAGLASAAAEVLRQASWALVCRDDRIEDLERRLAMPHLPSTASHHFSADLVLRYLPQVHRRARALGQPDALVGILEQLLREWPLSGVLAGLEAGPLAPLDFGGHEGLMLLYAERLGRARPAASAWRPVGRPLEFVELVAAGTGSGGGNRP